MKKDYINILTTIENMTNDEIASLAVGFVMGVKVGDRLDECQNSIDNHEKSVTPSKPKYPSNTYKSYKSVYKVKKRMSSERLKEILKRVINAYELELDGQDYYSMEELHGVVLNELGMTQEEYEAITGKTL